MWGRSNPPFSLHISERTPLTVLSPVRGGVWMITARHGSRYVSAGEVAVIRGSETYLIADDPNSGPPVVLHPGQPSPASAEVLSWEVLNPGAAPRPRDTATALTGARDTASAVTRRLLHGLPPVIILRDSDFPARVLDIARQEASGDRPDHDLVLRGLLELVVAGALRARLLRHDAPAWYHAYSDPSVGRALRLLQHHPAHRWTVAGLAAAVGVSRAALAKRFTALVGEPPMAFLTEWRLSLAADLFRETDHTVDAVARHVGYSNAFALSAAFKRHFGVPPRDYRAAAGEHAGHGYGAARTRAAHINAVPGNAHASPRGTSRFAAAGARSLTAP
ncbi:AraC family transcriptional regulator [Nocardia sp. NPDC003345]